MSITIALAKGRLAKCTMEILTSCGVDCSSIDDISRKLTYEDASGQYKFLLVKPSDVPTYVEHGVADMGIAGKDTLLEANRPLYEMLDLKIGACRICVCAMQKQRDKSVTVSNLRVATKYPRVAREYYALKGETVEVILLNGSVEIAPMLGLSDVIVDIVESGKTLQENGLAVIDEVCECSARVVVNRVSLKTKKAEILGLIESMRTVIGGN